MNVETHILFRNLEPEKIFERIANFEREFGNLRNTNPAMTQGTQRHLPIAR